ncbi:MAG TPA: ABC transporter ATP-binding protein [Gammaproteobacteria bacterium]|nr:ABC transporter ATP-binding protein [Gammaproteobacteria bacterium]
MIRVDGVSKQFKLYRKPADRLKELVFRRDFHSDYDALHNVSFEVQDGESFGIVGRNGAGKSTLLKVLTGVLLPDNGRVSINGKITGLLELGTGFNGELTGLQNIRENGLLLNMSAQEIDAKRDAIIAFAELGDFIHEPIKTYSSGMVMRLAFSVAIHADPKCFVVDEALSVGDAYFQQKCVKKIKQFRAEGGSIIFVSHDMNAVKMLCNRAMLLDKGRTVAEGTPEQVVNAYNYLISQTEDRQNEDVLQDLYSAEYGTYEARIISAEIRGLASGGTIVSSGEDAILRILIGASKALENVSVGLLIRDKYGQDVFGTNTRHLEQPFSLEGDSEYVVEFRLRLDIAPGKYTVTVAVHTDETHLDQCFHWHDKITSFEVAGISGSYFIGMCRLYPSVTVSQVKAHA